MHATGGRRGWVAAQLVLLASLACDRQPPIIGTAYWVAAPSVLEVVRQEVAGWPGGAPAEIRRPSSTLATHAEREIEGAAQLAALPQVVAVVGHQDSRTTLLAAPVYHEAHVPLVVPTATNRAIGTASPWIFPLAPNDSQEGAFIVTFAQRTLRAHNVAILYDNDEYGRGLRDGVRGALAAAGAALSAEAPIGAVCDPAGGSEASLAFVTPSRHPPDVLVIASRPRDAGCIIRNARHRVPTLRFITADAVEIDDDLLANIGAAVEATYFVAFWDSGFTDERSTAFTNAYRGIVGTKPTPGAAMHYDALMLVMHAIRDVGPNRVAIQTYLSHLGDSRPAYQGVTGPIAFGGGSPRPLYMLRVRGGAAVPVPVP